MARRDCCFFEIFNLLKQSINSKIKLLSISSDLNKLDFSIYSKGLLQKEKLSVWLYLIDAWELKVAVKGWGLFNSENFDSLSLNKSLSPI